MSGSFPPPVLHGGFTVWALAVAGDDVWAVGRGSGPERVALSPAGAPWATVADAGDPAQLAAVAATAADDVWVVGHERVGAPAADRTYVAHRDATGWRRVPGPNAPTGSCHLAAVAAQSRDDALAVGGTTTSPLGGPAPAGVADTFVLRWDGTQWVPAPSPRRGAFLGVCAVGPGSYWAVGNAVRGGANVPLAARFAGGAWDVADVPGNGPLFGVAATGPDDVWAVGQDQDPAHGKAPLVLHYDGRAWESVAVPAAPDGSWLTDVACAAPDDIWAVGGADVAGGGVVPLVLHGDGTTWARVDPPPGAASTVLEAVVARAGHGAWAGGFADPSGRDNGYPLG